VSQFLPAAAPIVLSNHFHLSDAFFIALGICLGEFSASFIRGLWFATRALILKSRNNRRGLTDADNPRCFCPDCGADLGYFYSNRIRMERR
jgi:hypothetical protein